MISLIIPAYNERENLEELIKRIFAVSKGLEVIVVDDNSRDGTTEAVMLLSKKYRVKLLVRPKKMGLTSAVTDGIKLARGDVIGVMDADLYHPPEKIPEMIRAMKDSDVVIGSRYVKGGKTGFSRFRNVISLGAITIAKTVLDIKVKDPVSGFFFCKREIIEKTKINAKGFKILLNILAKNKDKKIKEIPIVSVERRKGRSKFGFREIVNYIITVLSLKLS